MTRFKQIKKTGVKKYDDILENIDDDLNEMQIYQFIMYLLTDLLVSIQFNCDSDESIQDYNKSLEAYNILIKILEKNGGVE